MWFNQSALDKLALDISARGFMSIEWYELYVICGVDRFTSAIKQQLLDTLTHGVQSHDSKSVGVTLKMLRYGMTVTFVWTERLQDNLDD